MTQPTPSKRPRRKQAVPVKYEFSDDSDDDFGDGLLDLNAKASCKLSSEHERQFERKVSPEHESGARVLLKFKIKNSSSSQAYVERASTQQDSEHRAGNKTRRKRKCTLVKRVPDPVRNVTSKQTSARGSRNRKRYQTFPKSFKVEVVRHAIAKTPEQVSKEFRVPIHKVKHWMRTVAVKRDSSGRTSGSASSTSCWATFPTSFKLFAIQLAEEKGTEEAAGLLSLDVKLVEQWLQARKRVARKAASENVAQWETDVFIGIRRDMMAGHEVRVADLLVRAESLKVGEAEVNLWWVHSWCQKFGVVFKDIYDARNGPKEVSEVTLLHIPTDMISVTAIAAETRIKEAHSVTKYPPNKFEPASATKVDLEIWTWYRKMQRKGNLHENDIISHGSFTRTAISEIFGPRPFRSLTNLCLQTRACSLRMCRVVSKKVVDAVRIQLFIITATPAFFIYFTC